MMKRGTLDLSVIIVHYRSPGLLADCLAAIDRARTRLAAEVLVIDNAPLDDAARDLAERHGARYLRNERNLGYGRAINQGLAEGGGRHYLILNPDVSVRPGSLDALVEFMDQNPAVGIAGPRLYSPDGSLQYSARTFYTLPIILLRRTPLGRLWPRARIVREHLMLDWDHAETRDVDWVLGGAILARRRAVEDVGGMDERFFLYFEDVDWCSRMHRRGWRVTYVPAAEMVHAHQRASAGGFLTPGKRMHLESALRFYEKWSLVLYVWKLQATRIRAAATIVSDLVFLSAAFLAAYFIRYSLGLAIPGWSDARPVFALRVYSRFIPFADAVAVGTFAFLGLYRGEIWRDRLREGIQLAKGMLITSLVVLATTFLFTTRPMSRFTVVLFFPLGLILVALGRETLRRLVAGVRERRIQLRRLAALAPREKIEELKRRFDRHGFFGYEPIYIAHEDVPPQSAQAASADSRALEWRMRLLAEERIAEVIVFESATQAPLVSELLGRLRSSGLPVTYVPLVEGQIGAASRVRDFMGFGGLALAQPGRGEHGAIKRATDIALSLGLLVAAFPLHLVHLALSRRGVRREERIGRAGRPFRLPLYAGESAVLRAVPAQRRYPALVRVLKGEMSFIGLVPLTPAQWEEAGPDYRAAPPDALPGLLDPFPSPASREASPDAFEAGNGEAGGGYARNSLEKVLGWNRGYPLRRNLEEEARLAARALSFRGAPKEPAS